MINFLERGSQGFAVNTYGNMADKKGVVNANGDFYLEIHVDGPSGPAC